MTGQKDWWLFPSTRAKDILGPMDLRFDSLEAVLETYVINPRASRVKAAPTLGTGITVTAHSTAWKLGELSEPIIPSAVLETVLLTITEPCTTAGSVTVTLDETEHFISLTTAEDTPIKVATAIQAQLDVEVENWTLTRDGAVITFVAIVAEQKTDAIYTPNDTGALGTMVTTQLGYGDCHALVRRVSFENLSDAGTYEVVLFANDVHEIARLRVTQAANRPLSGDIIVDSPVFLPGTEIKARCAFSGGGASKTLRIALTYQDFKAQTVV